MLSRFIPAAYGPLVAHAPRDPLTDGSLRVVYAAVQVLAIRSAELGPVRSAELGPIRSAELGPVRSAELRAIQ